MGYNVSDRSVGVYALDFNAIDLASNQYTCVVLGTASNGAQGTGKGNAALVRPAAGADILGVIQSNGAINEAVEVVFSGFCRGLVSSSATAGKINDYLASGADGTFHKAASGEMAVARACEDYQAGDVTTVQVDKFGKQ